MYILTDPDYYLIADHSLQFNLNMRTVKEGSTEVVFFAKTLNIEFHYLIGEEQARVRRLESSGEIEGSSSAQLSRWT